MKRINGSEHKCVEIKKTKYCYETYGKKNDVIVFVENILVLKISLDISSFEFF